TIRVTDGNSDIAEREFEIDIVEALSVTGTLSSPVTVNDEYSSSLVASGGFEPYTWSIVDGQLPDGLTLDTETGVISGTPTVEGTFNFTLRVTDSEGSFVDSPQSIEVEESVGDPHFSNVVLLAGFEGTDGSTSYNEGKSSLSVSFFGNAQIDTARFKFGASSTLFDGTGDYVSVVNSSINLSSDIYTIEGWAYLDSANYNPSTGQGGRTIFSSFSVQGAGRIFINVHTTG